MNPIKLALIFFNCFLFSTTISAAQLISLNEAALPPATNITATRGISRGPVVKLEFPNADAQVVAPFDLKVRFEARGEAKIDLDSVKVLYLKSPFVDLTPRLKNAISANGIDFVKAEVPPGSHLIRISVKDSEGRETNLLLTLVVAK
ncbi:hypothetical protein SAMN06296008_102129 [Polynucleobacter kasalickyi]|uniref:Uncharacterized protein n=1 Tax=Polynucleobacter kasalickyi TaxID=1938817 RepID=A0A1W1Y9G5_9BURK|nr:hypothetical protein SAMN06296008_102129 [Polynucleobacter kasalickyi]